jgi:hypothetical protein
LDALCIVSFLFLSPLGTLTGTINSVVYAFDLAVPVLLIRSWLIRAEVPLLALRTGWLLLISAGILPALTSIGYAATRVDYLTSALNCYRMIGVCALFWISSSRSFVAHIRLSDIRVISSLLMLSIISAMFFQDLFGIDTNLYEVIWVKSDERYVRYEDFADTRFIVLGMFKAQQALLLILGLCLCLSAFFDAPTAESSAAGKSLNVVFLTLILIALVFTGSKTSLLAALFLMLVAMFLSKGFSSRAVAAAILVLCVSLIVFIRYDPNADLYVNSTLLELIKSGGQDVTTLNHRTERYADVIAGLTENPLRLVGIYTSPVSEFNTSYFHNEYLGVLSLSGIPGLIIYVTALLYIAGCGYSLMRSKSSADSAIGRLCLLVFCIGAFHGATVAHLQPGALFISSTAFMSVVYGIAIGRRERVL